MRRSRADTSLGCDGGVRDIEHRSTFARVVCGVDTSDAGFAAARLGARVASPNGGLALVSVDDPSIAVRAGWAGTTLAAELTEEADKALARGRAEAEPFHAAEARVLVGHPLDALLAELRRREATLVVVGIHEHVRAVGIALGSVATHLLHEAPCSVLVVPAHVALDRWPSSIVVGLDGSPQSAEAASAARELGQRFGAPVRAIAARKDAHIDLDQARRLAPDLHEDEGRAVDALVVASEGTDLVVVGSRGLRGIRALGSVSEQVAHEARCPVLVVRRPSP